MKMITLCLAVLTITGIAMAQKLSSTKVPAAVKDALLRKYPNAAKVTWENEKGNYEANWGGKSGEDMSVQYAPNGSFLEQVVAISPDKLPASVTAYIKKHYKGIKISEAGKVTNAKGATMYEAEIKGKDFIFNEKGDYIKKD